MACKTCGGGGKSVPQKTQSDALVSKTFVTSQGKLTFEKQPDGRVLAIKVG